MRSKTVAAGSPLSTGMRACIEICSECANVCRQTMLTMFEERPESLKDDVVLLLDCAEACRASADAMLRGSPRHAQFCELCVALCEACATVCEGFDDPRIHGCAEVCRRCAASCREMAAS